MFKILKNRIILSNTGYKIVKLLVQLLIPLFASFYYVLGMILDLSNVKTVIGICSLVTLFLGICLTVSSKQYNLSDTAYDGEIVTQTNEETGNKIFSLNLNYDPEEIEKKQSILFKVVTK